MTSMVQQTKIPSVIIQQQINRSSYHIAVTANAIIS
jgi:hypothetical protein